MWHVRGGVEKPVDAMAAVAPHHREAAGLGVFLDDVSELPVADAGFHCGKGVAGWRRGEWGGGVSDASLCTEVNVTPHTGVDGLHQAFICGLDQFLSLLVHFAHKEGLVQVAMETIVEHRDVHCRKPRQCHLDRGRHTDYYFNTETGGAAEPQVLH